MLGWIEVELGFWQLSVVLKKCTNPIGLSYFLELSLLAKFKFPRLCCISTQDSYMAKEVIFPTKIVMWLRKTKPTKLNQKLNYPNRTKPLGISYFCELSLHAQFQLPKLCLIYMSTQDSYMAEKNQTNQTKPKTRTTKQSKTTWNILFLWVETACQISAS